MAGRDAHVEQRSLVIVEVTRVRRPSVKMTGELEHVIRAATLGSGGSVSLFQIGRQPSGLLIPSLTIAGSSSNDRPLAGNFRPEKIGHLVEARVARDLIPARRPDHLRNVRIHVHRLPAWI